VETHPLPNLNRVQRASSFGGVMASEYSNYVKFKRFCSQLKLDRRQIDGLFDKVWAERIRCAWCGKTTPKIGEYWHFPGGKINITFGYGSRYDMQDIDAHICDDCYAQKFPSKDQKYNKSVLQLLREEMAKCSTPQEKERAKKRFFAKRGKELLKDQKPNSGHGIYD